MWLFLWLQVARMVSNYFKEQEQKGIKAEKEEATKLKKIASHMSKMVKEFWTNIEKVMLPLFEDCKVLLGSSPLHFLHA